MPLNHWNRELEPWQWVLYFPMCSTVSSTCLPSPRQQALIKNNTGWFSRGLTHHIILQSNIFMELALKGEVWWNVHLARGHGRNTEFCETVQHDAWKARSPHGFLSVVNRHQRVIWNAEMKSHLFYLLVVFIRILWVTADDDFLMCVWRCSLQCCWWEGGARDKGLNRALLLLRLLLCLSRPESAGFWKLSQFWMLLKSGEPSHLSLTQLRL